MTSYPIKAGAEPLSTVADPSRTGGRRIGVLLSHGFTGSPVSMKQWGLHLANLGYAVEVPRLPGHGTAWQDMNTTTFDEWYDEIVRTFDRLAAQVDLVFVGGLSMGGTLTLRLAEDRPDEIAGLMLVNPAVTSTNKQLKLLPVLKLLVRSMPGIGSDIKKADTVENAYDRVPLKALHTMVRGWAQVRAGLPQVVAPLLLFRSAEDHVVDPSSAAVILAEVSSPQATEQVLTDSYHVATMDNDAQLIFDESAAFIAAIAG